VLTVVKWRQTNSLLDIWLAIDNAEFHIPSFINTHSLTARMCICYMTELRKIDSRLPVNCRAVAFLHVAYKSLRHGFNDELMDILSTACGQFVDSCRRYSNGSTIVSSVNMAAKLMKAVANKSLSTMTLIEIELSKAYLYRALKCKDSDSDSIYCLANVYLAVLYYTTGQYQTAIDHCTLVTRSQDRSQCSSHVVQGEILPKIDDDVDNVLGLAVLYQHVRTAALNERDQVLYVTVFTTQLFAYNLHIKYLSVTKCHQSVQKSSADELKQYVICIRDTQQLLIGDVLLFMSVQFCQKTMCAKPQRTLMTANKHNTSSLAELLQKSAIEHLTTFRQFEAREFGSVAMIVTTDYEALYAYTRGDYQRCLLLSTQNVHTLMYSVRGRILTVAQVVLFPEFIQLLDDDIVSLTALTLIVDPKCRQDSNNTIITQLTLSLYLMTQCQLKLRQSLESLTQTLIQVRDAQKGHPSDYMFDHLTLKLIKRKLVAYVKKLI